MLWVKWTLSRITVEIRTDPCLPYLLLGSVGCLLREYEDFVACWDEFLLALVFRKLLTDETHHLKSCISDRCDHWWQIPLYQWFLPLFTWWHFLPWSGKDCDHHLFPPRRLSTSGLVVWNLLGQDILLVFGDAAHRVWPAMRCFRLLLFRMTTSSGRSGSCGPA